MTKLVLSPILARDKYSIHSVAALVGFFLFATSFLFIFVSRVNDDRFVHDQQIKYIIDDIHLLAASLDVLDYQTVFHLSDDIMDHDLVLSLKVEDRYAYVLFDEQTEGVDYQYLEPTTVNIGENVELVDTPPGIATVVFKPYNIWTSFWSILLLSSGLSLTMIVPVALVLFMALNKYIATPLQHLNDAIKRCIEEGEFARVNYSSDTSFGDFAMRFNQMQERLESEVTRSALLSEKNKEGRLRAERMAEELRDERDQRNAEAQLMGDLLSANHQLAVYRTTDGVIRTNKNRFPALRNEAIIQFLDDPCFEKEGFEAFFGALNMSVADVEFIREKVNNDEKHLAYVIEMKDSQFWNAEIISIKQRLEAVVFSDRTEVYLAERAKSQDDKLRALGQLTSGVAHDFNNILGVISLATQSLKENLTATGEHNNLVEDVDIIENGSARAAGIVSHLLAFSREKQMSKENIDLAKFFQSGRAVLKAILQANIELELDVEEGLTIHANQDQFQTCIMNFATNSRHAMPSGGKFTIRCYRRNVDNLNQINGSADCAVIELIDTGEGIDKETLARIFDPFFTTKSPGKGTGLGLSMAYGFAKDLKGSLTCRSLPGHGTTFMLVLPLVNEVVSQAEPQKPTASVSGGSLTGVRMALVDDENILRQITKRGLESQGATVTDFPSLFEFQENIEQLAPDIDVVVSDNMLEDGHSGDVLDSLRAAGSSVPFIVVTGNETQTVSKLVASGQISRLVDKPFTINRLAQEIREVLGICDKMHG